MTSASGHWTISSSVSISEYSDNGWKYGNASSYTQIPCDYIPTAPFEVSWIATERQNQCPTFHIGLNDYFETKSNGTMDITGTSVTGTYNLNKEYHLRIYQNKIEVYEEDTLLGSKTVNLSSYEFKHGVGQSRYVRIKDFKIKSL